MPRCVGSEGKLDSLIRRGQYIGKDLIYQREHIV
jgi:hypothetical protein